MTIPQNELDWKPTSSPPKKKKKKSSRQVDDVEWCWKESKGNMERHSSDTIHGEDKTKRLILYPKDVALQIESAWKAEYTEFHLPTTGNHATTQYMIDFKTMEQVNLRTGYRRKVKRITASKRAKKEQSKCGSIPSAGTIAPDQSLSISPLPTVASSLSEFATDTSLDKTKEITGWGLHDVEAGKRDWWRIYPDLEDVPAYTCACQEHCKRLFQASPGTAAASSGLIDSTDKVGSACNRRSRCTKCQRYAHEDCLKSFFDSNNQEEKLCHACFDKTEKNNSLRCWISAVVLCPCYAIIFSVCLACFYVWLGMFLSPILIEGAFFYLPQKKKILDDYAEKGIKIDGIVTRRWCEETSDGDGGTRKTYHWSVVYKFPGNKAGNLYRLDVMKRNDISLQEWDQTYCKGAMVQVLALEGYPKSGRIARTVKPWTSWGLKMRMYFAILFSIGLMVTPSLLVLFAESTYLQEHRWPRICVYCLLGSQLVLCILPFVLKRYKKSQGDRILRFINYCSIKPGDLHGPGTKTGCLRHKGEEY